MYFKRLEKAFADSKLTNKQLAERSQVSEKTIARMLSNPDYHASIDVLDRVSKTLNITMQELFAETDVVLIRKEVLVDLEESRHFVDECKTLSAENIELREKVIFLEKKNENLQTTLKHKDEIISIHESYKSLLDGLARIITDTPTDTQ